MLGDTVRRASSRWPRVSFPERKVVPRREPNNKRHQFENISLTKIDLDFITTNTPEATVDRVVRVLPA
jgi:hypothetical protein